MERQGSALDLYSSSPDREPRPAPVAARAGGRKARAAVLPNFLIIGDAKAGTTSLYHYLRQHPDAYMPEIKEARFLAYDPSNPYHARSSFFPIKAWSEYLRLFEHCGDAKAVGEASPNYLRTPGTAERIKAFVPDMKLIVSLRNPAEREYSAYLMEYRAGREKRPFDQVVFGRSAALIKARFYWLDLKRYYDLFAPDRIRVILFDDLRSDPGRVAKELYDFLGLDRSFEPDLSVQHRGGMPRSRVLFSCFDRARRLLRGVPGAPPGMRRVARTVERALLQKTKLDPEIRRKILEICRDDIARTGDLIGRDLSLWLA